MATVNGIFIGQMNNAFGRSSQAIDGSKDLNDYIYNGIFTWSDTNAKTINNMPLKKMGIMQVYRFSDKYVIQNIYFPQDKDNLVFYQRNKYNDNWGNWFVTETTIEEAVQTIKYVDSSVSVSGDGSAESPFKTLNEAMNSIPNDLGGLTYQIRLKEKGIYGNNEKVYTNKANGFLIIRSYTDPAAIEEANKPVINTCLTFNSNFTATLTLTGLKIAPQNRNDDKFTACLTITGPNHAYLLYSTIIGATYISSFNNQTTKMDGLGFRSLSGTLRFLENEISNCHIGVLAAGRTNTVFIESQKDSKTPNDYMYRTIDGTKITGQINTKASNYITALCDTNSSTYPVQDVIGDIGTFYHEQAKNVSLQGPNVRYELGHTNAYLNMIDFNYTKGQTSNFSSQRNHAIVVCDKNGADTTKNRLGILNFYAGKAADENKNSRNGVSLGPYAPKQNDNSNKLMTIEVDTDNNATTTLPGTIVTDSIRSDTALTQINSNQGINLTITESGRGLQIISPIDSSVKFYNKEKENVLTGRLTSGIYTNSNKEKYSSTVLATYAPDGTGNQIRIINFGKDNNYIENDFKQIRFGGALLSNFTFNASPITILPEITETDQEINGQSYTIINFNNITTGGLFRINPYYTTDPNDPDKKIEHRAKNSPYSNSNPDTNGDRNNVLQPEGHIIMLVITYDNANKSGMQIAHYVSGHGAGTIWSRTWSNSNNTVSWTNWRQVN